VRFNELFPLVLLRFVRGAGRRDYLCDRDTGEIMAKTFQVPAILNRISFTKDNGLSLGFVTNELSDEEKVLAAQYHAKFGYLLFKPNQFTEDDIPETDALDDEKRTPSQRLRAVLYVLWVQRGSKGSFTDFYVKNLDLAVNRVKNLLE
jgi:hypothetical protein